MDHADEDWVEPTGRVIPKDSGRRIPLTSSRDLGDGEVDFPGMPRVLKSVNYRGWICRRSGQAPVGSDGRLTNAAATTSSTSWSRFIYEPLMMNRREFALGTRDGGAPHLGASSGKVQHHRCADPCLDQRSAVPWAPETKNPPKEDRTPAMALELMKANGVQRTVIAQYIGYRWDNRYALDSIKKYAPYFHGRLPRRPHRSCGA